MRNYDDSFTFGSDRDITQNTKLCCMLKVLKVSAELEWNGLLIFQHQCHITLKMRIAAMKNKTFFLSNTWFVNVLSKLLVHVAQCFCCWQAHLKPFSLFMQLVATKLKSVTEFSLEKNYKDKLCLVLFWFVIDRGTTWKEIKSGKWDSLRRYQEVWVLFPGC